MSKPAARRSQSDAAPAVLALAWLGSDQQGAQVLQTAQNMLAMEQATKGLLPPALAQVCKVARIDRQQITLAVPGAAHASKLRQLAPRIARALSEDGWNVTEVSVRVQAGLLQSQTKTSSREVVPLDETALQAFEDLQRSLRPGPLTDAIERLLGHHRK
ncbi:DciA family protein [Pollutimonas thiosulfatoxidans]|uniref:Flagellar hook-length control protein FliK n=1 Tax=Pollutimonas thiosulfatoxidans TaxID=2028345 RepID=A0A410GCT7_9BURK|nr:DciA family protein [Pollutimonas thiosulfatoxidans]QAA94074.1 flagellar hook-length control protein FliK [Pollutimonas thiosulfatoxidans]